MSLLTTIPTAETVVWKSMKKTAKVVVAADADADVAQVPEQVLAQVHRVVAQVQERAQAGQAVLDADQVVRVVVPVVAAAGQVVVPVAADPVAAAADQAVAQVLARAEHDNLLHRCA